jgi:hypothetical protein
MELRAIVPKSQRRARPEGCSQGWSTNNGAEQQWDNINNCTTEDKFGDQITKKEENMLRIGFQNIGGLPTQAGRLKDEILRHGISKYDFDIFGLAETNVDWRVPEEEDKLFLRSRFWWDSSSLVTAFNSMQPKQGAHQYGGTALFSLNKASHRVITKGQDKSGLGRWSWTRYRGKDNYTSRIISAYRPNDSKGPLTVYSQHKLFFQNRDDDRCPRQAFLEDLCVWRLRPLKKKVIILSSC